MKKFLLILITCLTSFSSFAQTLEEVQYTLGAIPLSTYVTDINNNRFLCGYYINTSGDKVGFVITKEGNHIEIPGSAIGAYTSVQVEGINDNNTIILQAINAIGTTDTWKGYFNATVQKYSFEMVNNSWQPGIAKVFGINNHNVYSGWYPNLSDRWLWYLNDSSSSPVSAYNAKRYYDGSNFYATYGFGLNDEGLIAGYYIDGSSNKPFVFDAQTNNFDALIFNNMKPTDINNNNMMVGEYKQSNGFYTGFYAQYSSGSLNNFTSMNNYLDNNTIQSIILGINDSMDLVGAYLHPTTGVWVGFILNPDRNEYRLPNFDYQKDTWKMPNSGVNQNTDIWTSNYYGGINYATTDPYANNGKPLLNNVILNQFPGVPLPASTSVTWKSFMEEELTAQSIDLGNVQKYEVFLKPIFFGKYLSKGVSAFQGYCLGYSYATLLRKYRDDLFHTWYGLPANLDISTVPNTNKPAIEAIERSFLKQYAASWKAIMFPDTMSHFCGLYRLKNIMLSDSASINPISLGLGLGTINNPTGGHNVLPYKIHTPKKFPFNYTTVQYDTLFVYDSSNDNDSTQQFHLSTKSVKKIVNSEYIFNASWPQVYEMRFQKIGLRDNIYQEFSSLRRSSNTDSTFQFSISRNDHIQLKNTSNETLTINGSGFSNQCSNLEYLLPENDQVTIPNVFRSDTNALFAFQTTAYSDSVMHWHLYKTNLSMGLNRISLPNEKDNGSIRHRSFAFGNDENINKNINAYFVQISDDQSQAVNFMINNLQLAPQDSILAENYADYKFRIVHYGNTSATYNLWTYTYLNDSIKQFMAGDITLPPNTSHSIQTLSSNGQIIVIVDNGSNGSNEDTLFITQVPLSITDSELSLNQIMLYPVPAQESVQLLFKVPVINAFDIVISDMSGRMVKRLENISKTAVYPVTVQLNDVAAGNYILSVQQHGKTLYSSKFVKQ